MGRLKIKQEDNSKEVVAYLSDVQPIATDLDNLIDEVENVAGVGRTNETVKKNADDISSLQEDKVDKVDGKGLSVNDYTTTEKDKLGLIEAEANKTTIANNLTETVVGKALDATQGKILDNKIGVLTEKVKPETPLNTTSQNLTGAVNEVNSEIVSAKQSTVKNKTFGSLDARLEESEQELVNHKLDYTQQKQLPHYNHAMQEYVNMDKYWDALRDGRIYTTEFNQFSISPLSTGTKKDDNIGKIIEPSTNVVAGRDDYNKIGLFKAIDVNGYVDENDDYHVTAIKGDGRFKNDGTMGDVYVMAMTGYQKRYSTPTTWGISYSDAMHAGFEVIDEAVKPDGTIRPYLLHAKYIAGRNPHEGNKLASISGVYAEFANMSHNGQITEFKSKGVQYSGKTSHDDYYVQLMSWLKYATLNQENFMKGCISYYLQYVNLVAETGVNRVIITNAQASGLVVGSTVSIGDYGVGSINADRQVAQNYNLANRVKITSIVDLGNGNSEIYVNSPVFNTTLTTTIATYPWNSGGCDNVLGVDGSPTNNTSGKEPFIINGIEMMVGGYEILQNLIILNNAVDNRIDVYANYDCMTYATSITSAYDLVGQLAQTNNTWKYGSKISIPNTHPSVILIVEAEASSTTGVGDGIYTNAPSAGGTRMWLSFGCLSIGAVCGLRCLSAYYSLASSYWYRLGRLSATGRSRRRAGVN